MLSVDASHNPLSSLNKQSPIDIISTPSTDYTNFTSKTDNLPNENYITGNSLPQVNDNIKDTKGTSQKLFGQETPIDVSTIKTSEQEESFISGSQRFLRHLISSPLSPISAIYNLYDATTSKSFMDQDAADVNENGISTPNQYSNSHFYNLQSTQLKEKNEKYSVNIDKNVSSTKDKTGPSETRVATIDATFTTMKIISSSELNSGGESVTDINLIKKKKYSLIEEQKGNQSKISAKIKKYFSLRNVSISKSKSISDSYLESGSPKESKLTYFTSLNSALHQKALQRQKIINELIETESAYIEFLKLMSDNLIEILETAKTTIKSLNSNLIFNNNIELMIIEHRKFLYEVQKLTNYSSFSSYSYYCSSTTSIVPNINSSVRDKNQNNVCENESGSDILTSNSTKVILSSLTTAGAALVCKLIAEKAINIYFYSEYFSTFSVISHLLLKLNALDNSTSKGIEKLLKAVQISDSKLDLSLNSLLQKPAARLGKYRIICETILKFMPVNDKYTLEIQIHLDTIKKKLNNINSFSRDDILQYDSIKKNIFDRLVILPKTINPKLHSYSLDTTVERNFGNYSVPFESLGTPILCGSLGLVWVEKSKYFCYNIYGILSFKSNMIICKIENDQKYVVKFMIPLGCCKIVETEATEGLYCIYKESFKLLFEYQFSTFELLFVGLLSNEISVWKEKLSLLTDFVNGPYSFDYSISASYDFLTYVLPRGIEPVDTSLNNCFSEGYDFLNSCYFGELLSFQIQYIKNTPEYRGKTGTKGNDAINVLKADNNSNSFIDIKKRRKKKISINKNIVTINSSPVLKFEQKTLQNVHNLMKDVYSTELPNVNRDKLDISDSLANLKTDSTKRSHNNIKTIKDQFEILKNGTRRISSSIILRVHKSNEYENMKIDDRFTPSTIDYSAKTTVNNDSNESITSISAEPNNLRQISQASTKTKIINHSKSFKSKIIV